MKSFLSAAVLGLCVAGVATADIDFEGTPGGAIPAGYAGMNWSGDFYSLDGTNYSTDSGYKVLGTMVGFNAFAASPISFRSQDGSEFDITALDAAAAWRNWLDIRFDGRKDGSTTQTMTVRITADVRNTVNLNFSDIDELVMTTVGDSGTNYWTGGDGTHCAYDNFVMGPPRYSMSVEGQCPGRLTISWNNATPNATQGMAFGNNLGTTNIPNAFPCAGTPLGIAGGVQLVDPPGYFSTGGSGSGSFSGNAGAAACGHYLQLVEGGTCQTTNVAQIP